jgi:hypothetical protein
VSILTCALSGLLPETYPLEALLPATAATRDAGLLKRAAEDLGCFKHSLEACRNEVTAKFDILVIANVDDLIRSVLGGNMRNRLSFDQRVSHAD